MASEGVVPTNDLGVYNSKYLTDNLSESTQKEESYITILGKFCYGGRNKICVLFKSIIETNEKTLIRFDATVSNRDEIFYLEPSSKGFVRIFNKTTESEKLEGRRIRIKVKESFGKNDLIKLIDLFNDDKIDEFKFIIKEQIEDMVKEPIELDIFTKLNTKEEIIDEYPYLFKEDNKEDEIIDRLDGRSLVECMPKISAVFGKKIAELEVGDQILTKISSQTYKSFKEDLSKLIESSADMLKATIKEIKLNKDEKIYDFILAINDRVSGKMSIEANSEFKLAIPKDEDQNNEISNDGYFFLNQDKIIIYGFIIFTFIITAFILLYFTF
ncbi:hypothetical protein [Orenia marismortui]|uniref:hypothetical protein n=1 Tax=Orenia marismortui TaxID=46469 RepID=UPI00035D404F|nr:hypothetical protein [Orenia marismortui]